MASYYPGWGERRIQKDEHLPPHETMTIFDVRDDGIKIRPGSDINAWTSSTVCVFDMNQVLDVTR
jgi:hypothetical protein